MMDIEIVWIISGSLLVLEGFSVHAKDGHLHFDLEEFHLTPRDKVGYSFQNFILLEFLNGNRNPFTHQVSNGFVHNFEGEEFFDEGVALEYSLLEVVLQVILANQFSLPG